MTAGNGGGPFSVGPLGVGPTSTVVTSPTGISFGGRVGVTGISAPMYTSGSIVMSGMSRSSRFLDEDGDFIDGYPAPPDSTDDMRVVPPTTPDPLQQAVMAAVAAKEFEAARDIAGVAKGVSVCTKCFNYHEPWLRYYTAIVLNPDNMGSVPLSPTSAGRSQPLVGHTKLATRAHTNIPRCGDNGLPRGWKLRVRQLSARASDMSEPAMDYFAHCAVRFSYNDHTVAETTLLDLIQEPLRLDVLMRENLSYEIMVQPERMEPIEALRKHLQREAYVDQSIQLAALRLKLRQLTRDIEREGWKAVSDLRIVRDHTMNQIAQELLACTDDTVFTTPNVKKENRELTIWIYFEGPGRTAIS